MTSLKKLPAVFHAAPNGKEPVREWLKTLDSATRRRVGEDIAIAEFGWPVGMPLCRDMGKGLYEIRSSVTDDRIARVLFTVSDGEMVLLHAFIKKTQKISQRDLDLAIKRMREYGS